MKTLSRCVLAFLLFGASPVHAQWLNHPTPGIPHSRDGRPNLSALAPRMADGKPDLSGVWGFDGGPSLFSYDFRFPENPTVSSVWPVTMADGQLFLHGAPLIPLSETRFVWAAGNRLEFFKDTQGRVTHFEVVYVEGNLVGRRMPDRK